VLIEWTEAGLGEMDFQDRLGLPGATGQNS